MLLLHTASSAQTTQRPPVPVREAGPPTQGYLVPGLDKPVEILVDAWGIPHIYAKSQYDAFVAQGFNAARDRLWQIDLWRRRGLGTLSEIFGASMVARDHAARLFLYRGDLQREWLAYASDTKRIAEAFVNGINAYVELIAKNPDLLPVEFRLLDYKPALWSAGDLVRIRAHGGWSNARSEVRRAQIGCVAGLQADLARRALEPSLPPKIPEGSDVCDVRDEILALYRLATSDVAFARAPSTAPAIPGYAPPYTVVAVEASETVAGDTEMGSGWAVSGRMSAGGKPLLALDATDQRRVHALPSARYAAHLSAPGLNAIGAGEPFMPGVAAGHNERIAWGAVRYPIDQEDVIAEQMNRAGDSVKWKDRWDAIETVDEMITVRGGPPVKVTMRFTRHGPIVHEDRDKAQAWVIRAGWLDVGMAPSMASLELMRAQGWEQFVAAMNRWGGPPAAQLYADVDGAIGWKAGGFAPLRRGHDGLLPVPGDGRFEWAGITDVDQLPSEASPARGWIIHAGQSTIVPERAAGTAARTWEPGAEWSPPWRAERIAELLERTEKKTVQDLFAMQSDVLSIPARRIVLQLKDVQTSDLRVSEAITLLRNWDFRLTPESPAAALFQIWYDRHLAPATLGLRSPPGVSKLIDAADSTTLLAQLEQPAGRPQRDTILVGTLRQAIADLEQRQGNNWLRWNWGALHRQEFAHPLSALLGTNTAAAAIAGIPAPVARPRPGGAFTVAALPYRASNLQPGGGASFRMVLDLGNWDNALALMAPGQSGDARSRHYADLLEPWTKDTAVPMLYTRGAIEKATVLKILLNPP